MQDYKNTNGGRPYSSAEDDILLKMHSEGATYVDMARTTHRTVKAIGSRLAVLRAINNEGGLLRGKWTKEEDERLLSLKGEDSAIIAKKMNRHIKSIQYRRRAVGATPPKTPLKLLPKIKLPDELPLPKVKPLEAALIKLGNAVRYGANGWEMHGKITKVQDIIIAAGIPCKESW